ncbi:MAG TPA: GNAT family N-acetyltransferase [Gaiellaceae bacterium]|nr:GNAT family N-acetyltransferase [Gaiellaceae bacterium]
MGIELRPMSEAEFADWLPRARNDFADELVGYGGADPDAARAKALRDSEALFPGSAPSPEQLVFVVEADGERVGELWVGERVGDLRRGAFVWNVRIDERHRGRGYGRGAMLLAEAVARQRGLTHIALNVTGDNAIARGLYRSLGYKETFVTMEKVLDQRDV